jgi:hypothetical protein
MKSGKSQYIFFQNNKKVSEDESTKADWKVYRILNKMNTDIQYVVKNLQKRILLDWK